MSDFLEWLSTDQIARSLLTSIAVVGIYVVAIRRFRRKVGLIHPPINPRDAQFREARVFGFSDRTLRTQTGGARHGLIVTVSKDAVTIEPAPLFRWLIPPGINDLEYYVKRSDIVSLDADELRGRKTIKLRFVAADRSRCTVTLMLKDPEGFLRAMQAEQRSG
jgi:hypothetical protein